MERSDALKLALWPVLLLLVACGGGGGDEEPAPGGAAPVITSQPQPVTVTVGQTASFSVIATGTAPLAYQWRRNGTPINGATSSVYTTPVTIAGDNGAQFSVVVGNAGGSTTSANALLTVGAALYSITANVSGLAGGSLTLQNNGAGSVVVTANGVVTIATGVASGAAYNITITSSPAGLTCVVGNGSGQVAAANVSNITVTCSAAPPVESGARYIEVWSTANEDNGYQLAVVDPAVPGTLVPVDDIPYAGESVDRVLHIYGGTWNPANGELDDPGVRHVVYWKNGSLYRVSLDKGGPVPAPVRLSIETFALATGMFVAAQNRDGSDAVIGYRKTVGNSYVMRFVSLLATPDSAPRAAPQFAGDILEGSHFGYALDPATGQIASLLWTGTSSSGSRLYRTDPDHSDPASIATFTNSGPIGAWPGSDGRMGRGVFFHAGGALRRYDDATGNVHVVFPGVTDIRRALYDDTHVYAHVITAGGHRLVRAPDVADSTGVVIASDGVLADAGLALHQTRDYLIARTSSATAAVSIRKTDGAQVALTNASGLLFSWQPMGVGVRTGYTSGNRVYYMYIDLNTAQNKLGSVLPDNTDRRELNGISSDITALPAVVAPHRLASAGEMFAQPVGRFLLKDGNQLRWVDAATGEIAATIGNWSMSLSPPTVQAPFYGYAGPGRVGAIGYAFLSGGIVRADAWLVSDQAGSLVRLTNNIP